MHCAEFGAVCGNSAHERHVISWGNLYHLLIYSLKCAYIMKTVAYITNYMIGEQDVIAYQFFVLCS